MVDYLKKSLDKSNRAVFFYNKCERHPFFANKQAINFFGDDKGKIDVYDIFKSKEASPRLKSAVTHQLEKDDTALLLDVVTITQSGEQKVCDVTVGYGDDKKEILFIEMTFKDDRRMEFALSHVNQSHHALAILNDDEMLSVYHSNPPFSEIFPQLDLNCSDPTSERSIFSAIPPVNRGIIMDKIKNNLMLDQFYSIELELYNSQNQLEWYSLELIRRELDSNGCKIEAQLTSIAHFMKVESQFKNINQYFSAIQELSDDLLFRVDIGKKCIIRREKTADGVSLLGSNIVAENFPESVCESGIIHKDDIETYMKFGYEVLTGTPCSTEVRMKSKAGNYGFRRIMVIPVYNEDETVKEMFGKVVNIQSVRELEEQAQYDPLTHVYNKRAMLELASETLTQTSPTLSHALFFIDLDDFKYINDHLGHSFGDLLLEELGSRLRDNSRLGDLVGRVGGDEFVIFLKDIPSTDILLGKAKMILSAISEDVVQDSLRHSIHGSIGIAVYPQHGTTYEELYHHADVALYSSKHGGKNSVTMYHETL